MSKFTKRIRQRMGIRAWLKCWKNLILIRLGIRKSIPPRYDEDYWEAIRIMDEDG
jgi:hypothetical protein